MWKPYIIQFALSALLSAAILALFLSPASRAADPFEQYSSGLESPATDAFAITPNDSTDMTTTPRALLLSDDATVKVTMKSGNVVSLPLVKGINSIRAKRVWATGTDTVTIYGLN